MSTIQLDIKNQKDYFTISTLVVMEYPVGFNF